MGNRAARDNDFEQIGEVPQSAWSGAAAGTDFRDWALVNRMVSPRGGNRNPGTVFDQRYPGSPFGFSAMAKDLKYLTAERMGWVDDSYLLGPIMKNIGSLNCIPGRAWRRLRTVSGASLTLLPPLLHFSIGHLIGDY